MKIKRAAAVPLILHDPFFSIWSDADHLYDKDPVHWCGERQQLRGYIRIDDGVYCFLGEKGIHEAIPQQWVDVTATATEYMFENQDVRLTVRFTSPILPDSVRLLSRPCSYVDFYVEKKTPCRAEICFTVSSDLVSVNYFGEWRKGAWTDCYGTIPEAVGAALSDREEVLERAKKLDADIHDRAFALGGEAYAYLCCLSYRQGVAAHKLIRDEEGNLIFLSKENDSNGCIGTVDVSYPSVPLFLLYNPELVKGMLRPIFRFASCDVWEYDFAPHDVGRYPYAWGQVYGLIEGKEGMGYEPWKDDVCPPLYSYPAGCGIYKLAYQMPVEECGNMLIMTEAVCMAEGSGAFAQPWMELLEKWVQYLIRYGADPGEQLCTDDFAGHLAHNTNLSLKAIMGIESYARLLDRLGRGAEAEAYHKKAKDMAGDWCLRADAGDHYMLNFGAPDTWSLKYNMVWDKIFGSGLFEDQVYEKELAWYEKMAGVYGVPLDSRASYTKSDWILWCAAMAEDGEQCRRLIGPVAGYLENSATRVPFSDWYDTETGNYCHFMARSVQGGIFMPLLAQETHRFAAAP